MKQTTIFKKSKKEGYVENILTPVTLSGVVVPWKKRVRGNQESSYKLVCSTGAEYFILADSEFKGVLSWYCWDEVRVVGLLNLANMTLIPQKVFPKGPRGEMENVIDLFAFKGRNFIKKMTKNINDLVLVPAALLAVMSAA